MNRPDYIGTPDWQLLLKKYDNVLPDEIIKKLQNNYPVQYLIGNVEFYNSLIDVNENVLIPRYETELLVEKVINLIKEENISEPKIIDLGTGSGAIAVSLAKEFNIKVDALDISKEALKVAQNNALLNNVKLNLINKDILKDNIYFNHQVIISNPPYVSHDEIVGKETKYEPQSAIFADDDGLIFYKTIINKIKTNKENTFILAFEIGRTQGKTIKELILHEFPLSIVNIEKDLNNLDRYILAKISF